MVRYGLRYCSLLFTKMTLFFSTHVLDLLLFSCATSLQVKVPIKELQEGTHVREFGLVALKDSNSTVATIKVTSDLYLSLREDDVAAFQSNFFAGHSAMLRGVLVLQASVCYEYLRGTRDEGSYMGPSRVLINKRRMRGFKVRQTHSLSLESNPLLPLLL